MKNLEKELDELYELVSSLQDKLDEFGGKVLNNVENKINNLDYFKFKLIENNLMTDSLMNFIEEYMRYFNENK